VRQRALDPLALTPKAIDNSRIVREVDPRARRELRAVFALVLALAAALALYAWPHMELRQTGLDILELQRVRERLVERNRKLRLEKASLEDLQRVEELATRELGLTTPAAENVIVVEPPRPLAEGARLASGEPAEEARN
jgi:cell division protein FtsL